MNMVKISARAVSADQTVEFLAVLISANGSPNANGNKQLTITKQMHDELFDKFRVIIETDSDDDTSPVNFILEEATD